MLEQRYRHAQFQDMMSKVQREQQEEPGSGQETGPKNGAGSAKKGGETLLAKAAREQMMHLEALQNLKNGAGAEDEGQHSGRSDEGQKNTAKKRRRRTGKK